MTTLLLKLGTEDLSFANWDFDYFSKYFFYYDIKMKNKQVKPHQTKELLHSKRNKRNEDAA